MFGLKSIQDYFEEESRQIQINKGFKIIILGDCKSGKTSLAYALEDFFTKSNQMEDTPMTTLDESYADKSESKFIEIHEFFMNTSNEIADEDRVPERLPGSKVTVVPGQRPFSSRRTSTPRSVRNREAYVVTAY